MKKGFWVVLLIMGWANFGKAQGLSVEYGPALIPVDQYFTISVKSTASRPVKIEGFPEVEGLQKSRQRQSSSTFKTGAATTVVYTTTQLYAPLREGEFRIKPFTLTVDGVPVAAPEIRIKVVPALPTTAEGKDSLPVSTSLPMAPEFVEVKENAFLTLHLPKDRVYVGEGVPLSLWFYVADTDLGLLDFYDFEPQILEVIRQLKQKSVLEEVLEQPEIKPENVKVGDKGFTRYKLYEAHLFPITAQDLRFPAVSLKMIKYRVAKNPSLLSQNRLPEYKTYATQPKTVAVQALPPHPLRDQVAVGVFRLREQLSKNAISLNQNLVYQMRIEGNGNISLLPLPQVVGAATELEIYPPEVRQTSVLAQGTVTGSKTFRYFMVGRQAGVYPLRQLLRWVYFNPVTARYDTLRPSVTIRVKGQEDENMFVRAQDAGNFYNIIDTESNDLISLDQFKKTRLYTNMVLVFMGVGALLLFILKENE